VRTTIRPDQRAPLRNTRAGVCRAAATGTPTLAAAWAPPPWGTKTSQCPSSGCAVMKVAYGLERRPMEHVRAGDVAVPADWVGSFVGEGIPTIRRHAAVIWAYGLHWLSLPVRDVMPCRECQTQVILQRDANSPENTRPQASEHAPAAQKAACHWLVDMYWGAAAVTVREGDALLENGGEKRQWEAARFSSQCCPAVPRDPASAGWISWLQRSPTSTAMTLRYYSKASSFCQYSELWP